MHSERLSCSRVPRHSVAIPLHASMLPSSLHHLHEAAVLDHAAGGVTTAHWPVPVTATAEPIENSAVTEGRHWTAFELDSLFQWNEDCWDTQQTLMSTRTDIWTITQPTTDPTAVKLLRVFSQITWKDSDNGKSPTTCTAKTNFGLSCVEKTLTDINVTLIR